MKPEPTKYPPEKRRKYPHMAPNDVCIWERFLDSTPLPNAQVAYDVHVGTTPTIKPEMPEWLRKHILAVYPKKIDVVIYFPNETIICEIKPFAGTTAIGQALSGLQLFKREWPHAPRPLCAIITDKPQPDIRSICTIYGILLLEDLSTPSPQTPPPTPHGGGPHTDRTA